ncbi:enoyl reductase [Cryptococcus neoformans]|nr:enoyl reductase [Cryptococcus neoformans var. grubii Th84]OXH17758.1 enoyl reductase [Cryptococcus neoformans var. grubii]OXH37655.1 enoyl reductase [Cryptococcus neoformans var. grubii]OXH58495.1 enoyl reductase [Cryptococcus neoformans var. grubii]OXH58830.1 enoyl reductase [Cryptococcus neoformans var. grubii]
MHRVWNPSTIKVVTQPTGISALSISPPGALSGCDYAGTVIKLGPNFNTPLRIGDKVAGCISGGSSTVEGSYAQYAVVESDMCFVVPEECLWRRGDVLGLVSGNPWYIIYGPSTSVGLFPTSLGKALGYRVLGICSPHSFSLVKSYSADVTIDYHNQSQAISEALDLAGISNGVFVTLTKYGIEPNPIKIRDGFKDIGTGLEDLKMCFHNKNEKVSGQKLVLQVS